MPDRNAPQPPVWDRIDFGRDAIVEASAGTGKTHTLQKLVLRLVADEGVPIEKILLVTFTEKAAGELRDRIRDALEKELAAGKGDQKRLKEALRGFDDATISTIHSFCQRVLREYAFENGLPMAAEVVASEALAAIARAAVVDTLRSTAFRDAWGKDFGDFLKAAESPSADDFATRVAKSVAAFRSYEWDAPLEILLPGLLRGKVDEIRRVFREAEERGDDIGALATALDGIDLRSNSRDNAVALYSGLPALRDGLADGGDWKSAIIAARSLRFDLAGARNPIVTGRGKNVWLANIRPEAVALCEKLADAVGKSVPEAGRLVAEEASAAFLRDLFDRAVAAFRRRVDEAGLLSYDDMIHRTADIVARPESEALRAKLREAYRVALVDEFQDTDGLQWSIFSTLFRHAVAMPSDGSGGPRLLLAVGDPKQAIYGFRGADVGTYLDARKVLADPATGQLHKLEFSFRSPKRLLDAFNDMFSDPDWFDAAPDGGADGDDGDRIVYRGVDPPPPEDQKRYRDGDPDGTGRGPVTLLESLPKALRDAGADAKAGWGNQDQCLPVFVRNAAEEIRRLLDLGDRAFVFRDKEGRVVRTRFKPGDFCFLVKAKKHARHIQRELDRLDIRHTFYKEPGLFASAEAESVLALLDFVASPHRRGLRAAALLSPFFGVRLDELESALSNDPPEVAKLVRDWTKLAGERKWSRLFDSFVFDTALRSPRGPDDREFDRRFAGVRQILDDLLAAKGSSALVLEDFADTLRAWRDGDADAGDEASLRERETDEDRVQIMTMHASKGLEFPVVFVPYGFSQIVSTTGKFKPDSVLLTDADDRRRRVFRIDGKPLEGDLEKLAEEEEKRNIRRLIYVVLTRARMKLYLPWSAKASASGIGSAGSALRDGFLCKAILRHFEGVQEAAAAVANLAEGKPNLGTAASKEAFDAPIAEVAAGAAAAEAGPEPVLLDGKGLGSLFDRRLHKDSFSSLHDCGADKAADLKPEPEIEDREDDEDREGGIESTDAGTDAIPGSAVPGGKPGGNAFHKVMESLCNGADAPGSPGFVSVGSADDFDMLWAGNEPLRKLVADAMRTEGLGRLVGADGCATERALGRMAWAALRAPLPFADGPRRLADVARGDRRAEVPFIADERHVAGTTERDGFLKGAVDLVFRAGRGGKFFILDWKTNALDAYDEKNAEAEMDDCGYKLQYRLYALAVADWLGGEEKLGGAVYLFVRGGEHGAGPAVFRERFAPGWRDRFRENAAAAICAVE